jgi:glycosyltransferase involved in cell wall biosynthesis
MTCQNKTILFVITQSTWGGAQKYVCDLANNLPKQYKIYIAIGENPYGFKDKLPKSATIIPLKHLKRNISPIHDIMGIFELKYIYKTIKPGTVHLNSTKAGILGSFATALSQKKQKPNTIYTVHGWVFNEQLSNIKKRVYTFLEKISSRYKDTIIVLSKKEHKDAVSIGIKQKKLITIPLGIEPINFFTKKQAREALGLNQQSEIFGTIANFYHTKGLDILLSTIAEHRELFLEKEFVIIGSGPMKQQLRTIIEQYKLYNIKLLGNIPEASLYLKAFDAFVLPSRKEGLPYVILEAMQAQLPIIATHVGGIPEMIKNYKQATIIPPQNKKELKKALLMPIQTFSNTKSKTTYSLQKMIEETKKLYC